MDYPGNFDTAAFPAGRRIAISRFMGTAALVLFFLIICTCGLLLWAVRSVRVEPFLISIDRATAQWSVIGRSTAASIKYSTTHTVQEALVGNFAANWFLITTNSAANDAAWKECNTATCTGAEVLAHTSNECAIFCGAGGKVYEHFTETVMPNYVLRAAAGETWTLLDESLQVTPQSEIDDKGGAWRVYGRVWSSISGEFTVVAFARVSRDVMNYPMTMGYYISDFNAYRLN